jgi:hypothetical protein
MQVSTNLQDKTVRPSTAHAISTMAEVDAFGANMLLLCRNMWGPGAQAHGDQLHNQVLLHLLDMLSNIPKHKWCQQQALCSPTLLSAASFAAGLFLMGICAAMPPMACTPRLWQVLISSCTYASMKGLVIVTSTLQQHTTHDMTRTSAHS